MTKVAEGQSGATISDVAERAGVSIRTVSRVLNKSPKVNSETRERIEQAIAQLHFRPSPRARALAMGRSFLIGMVHNDRNALVLDAFQRGIVQEAAPRGYELIVHSTPVDEGGVDDVLAFIDRSRVDGLILLPPVSGLADLPRALERAKVPAVALSSLPITGYRAVILAREREAAAEVARYLLALDHRRIALVNGPRDTVSAEERRAGFVDALGRAGVELAGEAHGDYGFHSGVRAAEQLLTLDPPPTAIFAANDEMAAGVLKVAATRGIAVPGALSVVGFDGSLLSEMLTPALTSVARPFTQMTGEATRQLIDRIEGKPGSDPAEMPLRLIEAESSGPAPR